MYCSGYAIAYANGLWFTIVVRLNEQMTQWQWPTSLRRWRLLDIRNGSRAEVFSVASILITHLRISDTTASIQYTESAMKRTFSPITRSTTKRARFEADEAETSLSRGSAESEDLQLMQSQIGRLLSPRLAKAHLTVMSTRVLATADIPGPSVGNRTSLQAIIHRRVPSLTPSCTFPSSSYDYGDFA